MSAIKQSMPASPATSTRFGCEKTYAHNEGVPLCTFASNRSPASVGKNIVSLVYPIVAFRHTASRGTKGRSPLRPLPRRHGFPVALSCLHGRHEGSHALPSATRWDHMPHAPNDTLLW